jgi:phosphoribosyl-AMP cyclohydrolase
VLISSRAGFRKVKFFHSDFLLPPVVYVQQLPQSGLARKSVTARGIDLKETSLTPQEREQGSVFAPIFDGAGLLTAVVVDADSREVLVVAHMNSEALYRTLHSRQVTFWSRSRKALWVKGETSGNFLTVVEVLVDCDQDALVIKARPAGPTCHTGATSCFYRRVEVGDGDKAALVKVKT